MMCLEALKGVGTRTRRYDGKKKRRYHLNRSYLGVYVCPMMWRELDNFSSGSVCMVLASNRYDEDDYYRDYADFLRARSKV